MEKGTTDPSLLRIQTKAYLPSPGAPPHQHLLPGPSRDTCMVMSLLRAVANGNLSMGRSSHLWEASQGPATLPARFAAHL